MNSILRLFVHVIFSIGLLCVFAVGNTASASVETPGTTCTASTSINGFKSYVYQDGDLHSFDYTVSGDTSPSVVSTTVDGRTLNANYSTTWKTGVGGTKKVHVDVPNWDGFSKNVGITVSIAPVSNPNCAVSKKFVVELPAPRPAKFAQNTPVHVKHLESSNKSVKSTSPIISTGTEKARGVTGASISPIGKTREALVVKSNKGGEKTDTYQNFIASILENKVVTKEATPLCKSWPLAAWIFLTIICILSIVIIVDSLPYLLSGNGVRFAVTLLGVFLALLFLWFAFDRCREHRWFPIVVTLITLGTLLMPTALESKKVGTKKFDF